MPFGAQCKLHERTDVYERDQKHPVLEPHQQQPTSRPVLICVHMRSRGCAHRLSELLRSKLL